MRPWVIERTVDFQFLGSLIIGFLNSLIFEFLDFEFYNGCFLLDTFLESSWPFIQTKCPAVFRGYHRDNDFTMKSLILAQDER